MAKGAKRSDEARERWAGIVDEWRRSGLGVRAFCRKRGVGEHSFYAWRRRLRAERSPKPAAAKKAGFLPVRVVSRGAPSGGIEIEFPSGHVIRAGAEVEAETLARAVALVGGIDGRPPGPRRPGSSRCPDVPKPGRSGRC
jgi:transposase-like protein